MFTKLEVTNSQGSLLTLQLGDSSNGINIRTITGLDPVKATIVSSAFANQDGETYQSSRRDKRNVVMAFELDPDPTLTNVLGLRRYLYSYFRPKDLITLKFYVDDTDDTIEDGYQIQGYVESCTNDMFQPDTIVNVSVLCMDPDFQDPVTATSATMTSIDAAGTLIPYIGTAPAGYVLTCNFASAVSEFSLVYTDPASRIWNMDFAYAFLGGDVLTVSTVPGNKYATLLRAGVTSSVLYAISPQSIWSQLVQGNNYLQLSLAGDTAPANISGSISYNNRFGEL